MHHRCCPQLSDAPKPSRVFASAIRLANLVHWKQYDDGHGPMRVGSAIMVGEDINGVLMGCPYDTASSR
jgi:hypothetical protein